VVPIELIAAEVEQHKHFGPAKLDQVADNALVTFQDGNISFGVLAEC